mgnify:CR=1 FL=1
MSMMISATLADALAALAVEPTAMVLAGGTDVMVEINSGHRRPDAVIAVGRIPELRTWSHDVSSATLRIGAGITYAELEREPFLQWVPALSQAARTVGSPQIRNRATVGGNLATASPAGDLAPALLAFTRACQGRRARAQDAALPGGGRYGGS